MDVITYALSKKYTEKMADQLGSLKGAPCTIKSIEESDTGIKVTFEWTGISGTKETSTILIPNGATGPAGPQGIQGEQGDNGVGIEKIEKINAEGLVDTYRITFTDTTYFDFEVRNGEGSYDIATSEDITNITKNFLK